MEKQRKGKSKQKKDSLPYFAKMNSVYQKHTFKTTFEEAFKNHENYEDESGAILHSEPFQCCVLPSVIKDTQFLEGLKDELLDQIFYDKNNDLYKFQQTDDLKKISAPHVRAIRKFLYEDLLDWVRDATGIPLTDQVDLTCSRYDYTDVLLCHDDELDTRRIAFILYLVPPWKPEDGGSLDLFDMDEHGQPKDIVKSIYPAWNTLAWFEVTEASHHQVAEVLAQDKTRLSVNGWFHGPSVPRPERYVEPPLPLCLCGTIEEEKVYEWINPIYLEPDVQSQIQAKFENDSEIELQGFIQEEKYHELLEALRSEGLNWDITTPPNKRHYPYLKEESIKSRQVIAECVQLFRSEAMFLTLSNLTGLSLHPLANSTSSDNTESDSDTETSSYTELVAQRQEREETGGGGGQIECLEDEDIDGEKKDAGSEDSSSEKARPRRKRRKLNSGSEGNKSDKTAQGNCTTEDGTEAIEKKPTAKCRYEVRKWEQGCYTLIHDTDLHGAEFALDAMLFCGCKGWQQEFGGSTSYIAKGEDEELLTVSPAENSLALVYRDKQTLRFVKHINDQIHEMKSPEPNFFDVSFVYYE